MYIFKIGILLNNIIVIKLELFVYRLLEKKFPNNKYNTNNP